VNEKLDIEKLREYGNNPLPVAKTKVVQTPIRTTRSPDETRGNNPIPPQPKPKR
jgi:hypothetical protein